MRNIPLTALLIESNVRKQGAGKDDDAGLAASIRELGVLQPIVVREEASGGYRIIFGHRRAQAAKAAGLKDIPAEVIDVPDDKIAAMQAAENMARAGMSELDEWRAMTKLQTDGLSLQQAAAAIGVKERDARRLDLLGSMHPDMLALMEEFGVPDREDVLRHIATAPLDMLATMKGDVLRAHLNEYAVDLGHSSLLAGLLVALCAGNVTVKGRDGHEYSIHDFRDLAAQVTMEGGKLEWSQEQLSRAAADAIGRIVGFDTPLKRGRSGPVADLLAQAFGARMPRLDTAEFLATVNGETIRALAKEAGIAPAIKKVSDLRAALVGKLPDWRPAEASFATDWRPRAELALGADDAGPEEDEPADDEGDDREAA